MTPTKLCFITGHYFGYRALRGILETQSFDCGILEISLLITVDATSRGITVGFQDVSAVQRAHGFRHSKVSSVKTAEAEDLVRAARPDYLLAIGLSELLPARMLDIPMQINAGRARHQASHACIGMHPTLLPLGRGRAPIPWTIIKGLSETGVTAFLLEECADAGGIIYQDQFSITPSETATTLYSKCGDAHQRLGSKIAQLLACRRLSWSSQDESKAIVWPKRHPDDGLIDFSQPLQTIDRLVRALTPPYPGAFFYWNAERVIVNSIEWEVAPHSFLPGTITAIREHGRPVIAAHDGFMTCCELISDNPDLSFELGRSVEDH